MVEGPCPDKELAFWDCFCISFILGSLGFLLFTRGPRCGRQTPFHLNPHFKLWLSRSQMPGPGSCSQNIQQLHSCPLALACLVLGVGRFLKVGRWGSALK